MGFQFSRFVEDLSGKLKQPAFKPNNSFRKDPTPALNPQMMRDTGERFRPGKAEDHQPVPSTPANKFRLKGYKPPVTTDADGEESWNPIDPIPARSILED